MRGAVELASAMIGYDNGVSTGFRGHFGIFDVENTLEDELAAPLFLDPLDVAPVELRIELFCRPGRQRRQIGNIFRMAGNVAEGAPLRTQHSKAPGGAGRHLPDMLGRKFRRSGKAVADILVALAENLEIKGENQGRATGSLGAANQVFTKSRSRIT